MKAGQRWAALCLALAGTLIAAYLAPSEGGDGVMLTARAQQAKALSPGSRGSSAPSAQDDDAAQRQASALRLTAIAQRDASEGDDEPANWTVMGVAAAAPTALLPAPSKPAPQAGTAALEAPAPSPTPQAPPLPFKWLGSAHEDGQASAFLLYQDQNLVVKVGDRIDGRYSVERIDANALTFVYLPLNETQTLNVGSSN